MGKRWSYWGFAMDPNTKEHTKKGTVKSSFEPTLLASRETSTMKDNLMIGVTRVTESPYHDDIDEADMTVKHAEIERFVRIHGKDKAEEKIRHTFERALDAAFQRIEV